MATQNVESFFRIMVLVSIFRFDEPNPLTTVCSFAASDAELSKKLRFALNKEVSKQIR